MYVTDDYVSCYGSANLDNRSFFLNYENNVYVYDKDVALQSRAVFEEDLTQSQQLTRKDTRWNIFQRIWQDFLILVGYSQW